MGFEGAVQLWGVASVVITGIALLAVWFQFREEDDDER